MNSKPKIVPPSRPSMYHRLSLAPANIIAPLAMTTGNAINPMNGLGNPKACACFDCITEPQLITGLRLQDGTKCGFWSSLNSSKAITKAQTSPIAPPMISNHGNTRSSFQCFKFMSLVYDIPCRRRYRFGLFQIMCGKERGHAVLSIESLDIAPQQVACLRVEVERRLVQNRVLGLCTTSWPFNSGLPLVGA